MKTNRPILTQHSFQRLILWTLTLLYWIAAILGGARVDARHQRQRFGISLPWLTRRVAIILIVRAGQLARLRRPEHMGLWRRGEDVRRQHIVRSALGARLRRKLRHKDVCVWLAQLVHVLRNLDTHAGPLAKRLRHGLTRLWRTWTQSAAAPLTLGPPAPPPAFSDSS